MSYTSNSILNNSYLAEDAVQQAFVKVIYTLHRIENEDSAKTRGYLVIICENIAKDMIKNKYYKDRNDDTYIEAETEDLDLSSNPLEFTVNNDTVSRITNIIKELKHSYRDVFLLKIYYNSCLLIVSKFHCLRLHMCYY